MNNLKKYFMIDPNIIFLNHGSFGATPKPIFANYQAWQARLEIQPVKFLARDLDGFLCEARRSLCEYLNADINDIVFIPNATYGVNIVARSLDLLPGDQILTTDHEYGACDNTWDFICEHSGVNYIHQSIPLPVHSDDEIVEMFWTGVNRNTKVIYISMITSPTAMRMPVERICEKARRENILTVVDAAHAPGQIEVDLQAIGADIVFGNCHKWMLSPKGAAFLYVRKEIQSVLRPLIVSWGYKQNQEATSSSRFIDFFQWSGTRDPSAYLSVPEAIRFMTEHQWREVRQKCHLLLRTGIQRICDLTRMDPLYPLDSNFYAQMGIAPLPNSRLMELKGRLYDEYKVEVPIIQWNDKQFVRISVQGYNSTRDLDGLVMALTHLLPQVVEN
jgi:isopenicillin-N epimerase